jgi:hypothetical protein
MVWLRRTGERDMPQESKHPTTKASLTASQARLIDLMQRLNFGRIEGLHVRDGDPLFHPPPRIFRDVKPGSKNGPRSEAAKADFALKAEVIDLFAQLEAVGNGVIERIEVQHGLPFRMTFEEDFA